MARYWISLPAFWKLQDVQATLNVVITVLCALGVFVFVRSCWQLAAKRIARNQDVALPTLLSLNTIGEALDVLLLLQSRLLSTRYVSILGQCIVVICLSTTAILSGPIARYSTRRAHVLHEEDVSGFLASRHHNGMGYANVEWNLTYDRLEAANFPRDQLLDFLPRNAIHWVFDPLQWNNSWSFDCTGTPQTPIVLHITDNCTKVSSEVAGLNSLMNYSQWDNTWHNYDGFYNQPDHEKDILMFIYAWKGWDYVEAGNTNRAMKIKVVALHMHSLPRNQNDTNGCQFAPGAVGTSTYTAIDCQLRRKQHVPDPMNVAFPDTYTNQNLVFALTEFYQARFTQESTEDSPISVITPPDLIRFYQVYHIIKDLQYRQPVSRILSVSQRVVQLSTAFLTIALFIALLIAVGIVHYVLFALRHHHIMINTPQSKLDWMMQSIQVEDRPLSDTKGRLRRSVTVDSTTGLAGMSSLRRKRSEFESAKYGGRETTTWFLRDSPAVTEYGASPRMDDADGIFHAPAQMVAGDKVPMLHVNSSPEGYYPRPL